MECQECGSPRELYMHSRCHPIDPTWAILDQEKSEVKIICSICEKLIVKFKVLQIAQ